MPLQTAIITDQAVCHTAGQEVCIRDNQKTCHPKPRKGHTKKGRVGWSSKPDQVNSLTCNHRRPSISFRHHEHSVNPDSCVNFTCAVYLYLRWWHTIFFVKRSSCMESKPSFRFLSGRFKISLHHQCFQSDIRFCFWTFFVCLLQLPLATPPPLIS
jgi:hypothetical protein